MMVHAVMPVYVQVMVVPGPYVPGQGRSEQGERLPDVAFRTKLLEANPGDMLRDPGVVFAQAEATAQHRRTLIGCQNRVAPVLVCNTRLSKAQCRQSLQPDRQDNVEYGALIDVVHSEVRFHGVLHRSLVSHAHVRRVSDVVSVGDKVKVCIGALALWQWRHVAMQCLHVAVRCW